MTKNIIVIIGRQAFQVYDTSGARKLIDEMGGSILRKNEEIPSRFANKPFKDDKDLVNLYKNKKPDAFEKAGNIFVGKKDKVTAASPGVRKDKAGAITGIKRLKGFDRGKQLKGAAKLAAVQAAGAAGIYFGPKIPKSVSDKYQEIRKQNETLRRLRKAMREKNILRSLPATAAARKRLEENQKKIKRNEELLKKIKDKYGEIPKPRTRPRELLTQKDKAIRAAAALRTRPRGKSSGK